jgi:hypothetical protein
MVACLVCGAVVRVGTLCREHALAVATCDDVTAEQIVSSGRERAGAWLIDQWGCTHPLASPAVVGRSASECNPGILHPSVSVLHAQIDHHDGAWRVVDRGSLNGTFVNNERVRVLTLARGDRVRFGAVSFYFSPGELPSVQERGKTGGTLPSRLDALSLQVTLALPCGPIDLIERPGGGVLRRAGETVLSLADLEFSLLAILVEARQSCGNPDLAFIGSRELAERLHFRSSQADSENVRELVRRVRKKVRAAGIDNLIESRQRVGYRLTCEVLRPASRSSHA